MKTSTSFLILAAVLLIMIFTSCSASEPNVKERLEFISKSELNKTTTMYKYKFNFENNAWMDVTAYVKKDNSNYIISINRSAENSLNICTYSPEKVLHNFKISNRIRFETVVSLDDAIVKTIMFYLADNI